MEEDRPIRTIHDEPTPAAPGREAEEAAVDESEQPPENGEGEQAALGDKVEAELDELGQTKKERDEYLELARRTRADFENYRKRAASDAEQAGVRATGQLVAELIAPISDLERAIETGDGDAGALVDGLKLVHRELSQVLDRAGVEAYDPAGEKFDPQWHEALQTRPQEGTDPGVVLETLDKGYRLDGQVLRPARVVVSA